MGFSMPCWRVASTLAMAALLGGCGLGETPERAEILVVRRAASDSLEITQQLRFSEHMRETLDNGIPLRLAYRIDWCDRRRGEGQVIELRYSPLSRDYRMRRLADGEDRRFSRSSALFAALDRVRLPVKGDIPDCGGQISVALDLTSLPTPLRFPAFLEPSQWRLVSPEHAWSAAQP
ncbi:MAG TPA: DUF4390 domain-containing protein [Xanthomonadaceae bacterium]|nr:DUF4390 domain-containing protein [Xanthomonadaceae bacterium]